jgi:hypothetical protein
MSYMFFHFVPIGEHMIKVLDEVRPISGKRTVVFPSYQADSTPVKHSGLARTLVMLRDDYDLSGFTTRNTRAAVKTHLGDAGVDRTYIDYLQNHVVGSAVGTKHYDKSLRMDEKRVAMAKWDELLGKALVDYIK